MKTTKPPINHSHSAAVEDDSEVRLLERPDGFYWLDKATEKMNGPFSSRIKAMEDMQYQEDSNYEEGETLQEAEAEIGIADWIDPDTGEPAEGSTPHLNDR